MQKGVRRVWILGAGFSQSLGGPLLVDLFRQERQGTLVHLYKEADFPGLARICDGVRLLYNYGRRQGHWANAETFIAQVDVASDRGSEHLMQYLQGVMSSASYRDDTTELRVSLNDDHQRLLVPLLRSVRQALAVECSRFLQWTHPEVWMPYDSWGRSLDPACDTVVTFNYDLVLETIGGDRLNAVLPHENVNSGAVPVYKLHGSVDWINSIGRSRYDVARVSPKDALNETERPLAMGVPGASKMGSNEGPFSPLWGSAMKAIRDAQEICIIGYSFPISDAYSVDQILRAIRENQQKHLRIDLVFGGPGVGEGTATRAMSLLRSCKGSREWIDDPRGVRSGDQAWRLHVVHQQLFAQEFLPLHGYYLETEEWPSTI
jgi:hypothetical protein